MAPKGVGTPAERGDRLRHLRHHSLREEGVAQYRSVGRPVLVDARTTIGLHYERVVVGIPSSASPYSTAPLRSVVLSTERANFDSQLGGTTYKDIIHNT